MAHIAQIGFLVDDLITDINKNLSDSRRGDLKHWSLALFADQSSARTNQFEVSARLEGLEEKCRILNNDPLADALHARLQELSSRFCEWAPEILSLLLELSDRPVQRSIVEDLTILQPDEPPAPLTWSDIVADDPWNDDDDLWKNLDFRRSGSDDEDEYELIRENSSDSDLEPAFLEADAPEANLDELLVPTDDAGLGEIESAQFWRTHSFGNDGSESYQNELWLTESQAVREVIFMLLGLPTSLYRRSENDNTISCHLVAIRHISPGSSMAFLQSFAEIGTSLLRVRQWVTQKAEVPLEQTFQAALASRLRCVDRFLSGIQTRVLDPKSQSVTTLLSLQSEVLECTSSVGRISQMLVDLMSIPKSELPFRILERLFEEAGEAQMLGDFREFEFVAEIFFDCFRAYLQPVRLWMEEGQLSHHHNVMFIKKVEKPVPLDSMWRDQYQLIVDAAGNLHAPDFLHLAVRKIFNTGKSINFLRHLGYDEHKIPTISADESVMKFQSVYREAESGALSPFPELFREALDSWIATKHRSLSLMLCERLETECGLQRCLGALEYIFFGLDGALSNNIAFVIFERIESGNQRWNDSFVLTELSRTVYGTVACIDVDRLSVRTFKATSQNGFRRASRSMSALENLRVDYVLPWPVANIIQPRALQIYQRIHVFLTQISRAKYLLQQHRPWSSRSRALDQNTLQICDVHHRLLWFTNTLMTYITHVVIVGSTTTMRFQIRLTEDVDSMIEVHELYIADLENHCFLTQQHNPLRQALVSILDLAVLFSDLSKLENSTSAGRGSEAGSRKTRPVPRMADAVSPDSSEDSDADVETDYDKMPSAPDQSSDDRLLHIRNTFSKLHSFVMVTAQNVSKADNSACWEILANNLAVGMG